MTTTTRFENTVSALVAAALLILAATNNPIVMMVVSGLGLVALIAAHRGVSKASWRVKAGAALLAAVIAVATVLLVTRG